MTAGPRPNRSRARLVSSALPRTSLPDAEQIAPLVGRSCGLSDPLVADRDAMPTFQRPALQGLLESFEGLGVARLAGQVVKFLRVGRQVEQLGAVVLVVHVFPAAIRHYEGARLIGRSSRATRAGRQA